MNNTGRVTILTRVFFTIICLFIFMQVHAQSLSAKELINLLDNENKSELLKSHSFKNLGSDITEKGSSLHFQKSVGTSSQETIVITSTLVSYLTRSKTSITNLLKQLEQHYKAKVKDDNSDTAYYLFSVGEGKTVSVNISKTNASFYSLEVIQK